MENVKIKTEKEFEIAAIRIDELANSLPGTKEAQELKGLVRALIIYIKTILRPIE